MEGGGNCIIRRAVWAVSKIKNQRRSCLSIQQVSVIGVEEMKRLNMSSCIVEDREQLLEEFRKKGEYGIIIMKYLLKGGISELLY